MNRYQVIRRPIITEKGVEILTVTENGPRPGHKF